MRTGTSYETLLSTAEESQKLKDYLKAEGSYRTLLKSRPPKSVRVRALLGLATMYFEMKPKQLKQGITCLRAALANKLSGDQAVRAYFYLGEFLDSEADPILVARGKTLLWRWKSSRAKCAQLQVLKTNPNFEDAALVLKKIGWKYYLLDGDLSKAEFFLREALKKTRSDLEKKDVEYCLGQVLVEQKRFKEAYLFAKNAATTGRGGLDKVKSLELLGIVQANLGLNEEAIVTLRSALSKLELVNETDSQVLNLRVGLYLSLASRYRLTGNHKDCIALLKQLLTLVKGRGKKWRQCITEANKELGFAEYSLKHYSAAADAFTSALKFGSSDPLVWAYGGSCFRAMGKYEKAMNFLRHALMYRNALDDTIAQQIQASLLEWEKKKDEK